MDIDDIAGELLGVGAAVVHESYGPRGVVGPSVRAVWPGAAVAGPCRTVRLAPGDNLGLHVAVEHASPGEVICVDCGGAVCFGYWGGVMTRFALQQQVAGLVINGGVRDVDDLRSLRFPVFAATRAIQGTAKQDPGEHQVPISIDGAIVRPGDWIVADVDGAVVVRVEAILDTIEKAHQRVQREEEITAALARGATTREALGLK